MSQANTPSVYIFEPEVDHGFFLLESSQHRHHRSSLTNSFHENWNTDMHLWEQGCGAHHALIRFGWSDLKLMLLKQSKTPKHKRESKVWLPCGPQKTTTFGNFLQPLADLWEKLFPKILIAQKSRKHRTTPNNLKTNWNYSFFGKYPTTEEEWLKIWCCASRSYKLRVQRAMNETQTCINPFRCPKVVCTGRGWNSHVMG